MSLADVQSLVDDLVRDTDQVISSLARDTAIAGALARYSEDAPRRVIEDAVVDADGNLPLPAAWTSGASVLYQAEYPIGGRPPTLIPADMLYVVGTPGGDVIQLLASLPAGETVRLTFSGAHALDAATDTVPLRHRHALAALAASDLCGQLASNYSNEGTPTIGADTVDHQGKSDRWRARARDLAKLYEGIVGPAPSNRTRPASADVTPQRTDSLGRSRLFHPPRGWTQ